MTVTQNEADISVASSVLLIPGLVVDLDSTEIGDWAFGDLSVQTTPTGSQLLVPLNGARIASAGSSFVDFANCLARSLNPNSLLIDRLRPGDYLCVLTSEGRTVTARVQRQSAASADVFLLSYLTWEASR